MVSINQYQQIANWLQAMGYIGGTSPGTVSNVSVATANGFGGTVANPTTTPAITLTTNLVGVLKGNGSGLAVATAADFPILNQNTTGSAAKLTTARNIDGQSFDGSANITVVAPATHAAASKATPVDADELPLADSASAFALAKLTWANLKATLKTYLDTLYLGATRPVMTSATLNGITMYPQGPSATYSAPGNIASADLFNGIIKYTAGTGTLVMPAFSSIQSVWTSQLGVIPSGDTKFLFSVINTGAGTLTLGTNTGITFNGSNIIATAASGYFACRYNSTGINIYRLA